MSSRTCDSILDSRLGRGVARGSLRLAASTLRRGRGRASGGLAKKTGGLIMQIRHSLWRLLWLSYVSYYWAFIIKILEKQKFSKFNKNRGYRGCEGFGISNEVDR